jgi:hypothetical protein
VLGPVNLLKALAGSAKRRDDDTAAIAVAQFNPIVGR